MGDFTKFKGIYTQDLRNLLIELRDTNAKGRSPLIRKLKKIKPLTNYSIKQIPCGISCKHFEKRIHYQIVQIEPNVATTSAVPISAHVRMTGLTPQCTLWIAPRHYTIIEKLYKLSR